MCLRCMRKIGENTSCPYCRNEINKPQKAPYLPLKTVVGGRYLVGKLADTNGEGSTYNAFDLEMKKPVTLRELFPQGILTRGEENYCLVNVGKVSEFIDIKTEFVKLWKKLSSLKGFTALIRVTDIFEDLGTVYTVSEFLGEGKTLRDYLLEKEQGYISWDEARVLFMPVLSALDELHCAGIIHGGISPTTLVVDSNGKMRITGYCVPDVRNEKGILPGELFDGYAAVEQYGLSSGVGEYTDIYAFAAVLYRALIGSTPISSASRLTNDKLMIPGKFAEKLPAYVINALVNGLQVLPEDRTETVEQLRDELSASPSAAGTAAEAYSSMYDSDDVASDDTVVPPMFDDESDEEAYAQEDEQTAKKKTILTFVISAVVCLVVLIVVLLGVKGLSNDGDDTETTSDSAVSTEESVSFEDTQISNVSVKIPDFVGKLYDDIKDDSEYKQVLTFKTEYVDSEKDKGTVISQSLNAGTEVTSLNPRTITLKVSNGLKVPDVIGISVKDAKERFESAGFKRVQMESGQIASNSVQSNTVYRVVYDNPDSSDWAEIPDDGRLSASDTIILYYYGEFVDTTASTAPTTTEPSTTEEVQDTPPVEDEVVEDNDEALDEQV